MSTDEFRPDEPPALLKARYHLQEQIGKGAMAVVYRAHDEALARDVAIKFLAPHRLFDETSSQRFLREARAVARLSHPNIMSIFDTGRQDHWHYLVLEYIDGQELYVALVEQGGSMALEGVLRLFREILEGLAYAHQQGVIHRDIKTRNIMLTADGHVKLTDFGLASVQGDVQLTQDGILMGTLLYMAPELLMGKAADEAADLYAAGAVCYEMLAGNPPYEGQTPTALITQILNFPLPSIRSVNTTVPVVLEKLISRLLAKRPAERFQTAEEVLMELRGIEASLERPTEIQAIVPEARLAMGGDSLAAIEGERRRLATVIEGTVIESLNLLLAQASLYEQSMAANPQARTAASVLASLARQTLQHAHDLADNLHPLVLETLGLVAALESLADQVRRSYGMQVRVQVDGLHERLPAQIELALYRAAQDALDRAARHARASQIVVTLAYEEPQLNLRLADNGAITTGLDMLRLARQRIEGLGGQLATTLQPDGGLVIDISLQLTPPINLTPRESEVLALLVEGMTSKAIAHELGISPRTVNYHLDNMYAKLGVNSRTEAVVLAMRYGLVGN